MIRFREETSIVPYSKYLFQGSNEYPKGEKLIFPMIKRFVVLGLDIDINFRCRIHRRRSRSRSKIANTEITDEFGCPINFWDSDSTSFSVSSAFGSQADIEDLHRVYRETVW
jgi:hypothetical protein